MAGPLVSSVGLKTVAAIGTGGALLSSAMVALDPSNSLLVPIGLGLMGITTDSLLFPAYLLSDYFPSRASLVISSIAASTFIGTLVPPLLISIVDHHPTITIPTILRLHCLVCVLPACLLYLLVIPKERRLCNEAEEPAERIQKQERAEPTKRPKKNDLSAAVQMAILLMVCGFPAIPVRSFPPVLIPP